MRFVQQRQAYGQGWQVLGAIRPDLAKEFPSVCALVCVVAGTRGEWRGGSVSPPVPGV